MSDDAHPSSLLEQKNESSLTSYAAAAATNDIPEIKFPFELKWFVYESALFGGTRPSTRTYHIPGFPGLKFNASIHMHFDIDSEDDDIFSDEDFEDDDSELNEDMVADDDDDLTEKETTEAENDVGESSTAKDSAAQESRIQESAVQAPVVIESDNEEDMMMNSLRVRLVPTTPKYKNYKVFAEWEDKTGGFQTEKNSCYLNDYVRHYDQKEFLFFDDESRTPEFFIAKGTFTIKKIYSKDVEIENVPEEHLQLSQDEDGKDFTLVAGKKDIKIHKSVLIHNSPVFAAAANEKKWKECDERKYAIPDFSHKIVQIAVNVIYGQAYGESLTKEEYVALFQFADKYQMDELKKVVKESVILTPHNVCEYLNLCHSKKCDELLEYCLEYMFIFSQNGYPISNKGILNPEVKVLFADRTLEEPLKHRVAPKHNYYSWMDDETEQCKDYSETDYVGMGGCDF